MFYEHWIGSYYGLKMIYMFPLKSPFCNNVSGALWEVLRPLGVCYGKGMVSCLKKLTFHSRICFPIYYVTSSHHLYTVLETSRTLS